MVNRKHPSSFYHASHICKASLALADRAGLLNAAISPRGCRHSFNRIGSAPHSPSLPGLFAGFFLGPLAGFGVVVIKLLLKIAIQGSETAFVGEFSNLVSSTLFVVLAAWIYKVDRTKKGAVIAMAASTVAVSILAIFLNAYIMFPLYSRLYGMPMEAIIGMGTAINPRINSLITMMLFSILPFNLVKHLVTSLITFLVYKRAGNVLRGILYN